MVELICVCNRCITFTVNNMTDSRPNLRPNVSYCRVDRDHGRSGQLLSEMVRKLDMYVSIDIQEKAIALWSKLDTLKDKPYRDLPMEMHIAQTKAAENKGASLFPHMIIQQIISENFQMPKSLSVKGSAAILLTTLRECKDKMNGYRQTSCINS